MANRPDCRFHGKMTLEKAAMMRFLHHEGATVTALALAFGCAHGTAEKIVQLRQWTKLGCRGCWRLLTPAEKQSGLCAFCKEQFCCHCGAAKDPGRKSARCPKCDREKWNRACQETIRCRECGEQKPPARRDTLCADCRREYAQFTNRYRDNSGKTCATPGCTSPLPNVPSWTRKLCRLCAEKHDRLRRGLSRRRCRQCDQELSPERRRGLCTPCAGTQRVQRTLEDILGRRVRWERAARIYKTGPSGCQSMYRRLREAAGLGESLQRLKEIVET